MEVINAEWEIRNTGLKTCELEFGLEDTIDDYLEKNIEKNYEYIVAKVSADNIILIHKLEDIGFRFIETQFVILVETHELEKIDHKWDRVLERTNCKKIRNRTDLKFIQNNIEEGMFKNDRISMDERLSKKISSMRYANWINDLYENDNTEIFLLEKNNSKAGFFVLKKDCKNAHHSVIAGIFKKHQGRGLSFALIYYYLKIAADKHVRCVYTSFSSNNIKMLNTFTKTVSFKTIKIHYVLRKIIER